MRHHPILDRAPAEVPLSRAPLELVIVQVRFPLILAVEDAGLVASFQEAIRESYPILRREEIEDLGPMGTGPSRSMTAWRFSSTDEVWRVSLTPQFLTLETRRYSSRKDLLGRFEVVVRALAHYFRPATVDRLGIRYLDRIAGLTTEELLPLIQPELRGVLGSELVPQMVAAFSESMFEIGSARLAARWGLLPPGTTIEAIGEPLEERSFILDLDMFSSYPAPFGLDEVVAQAESYADRIYSFFRWMVTDAFLERYGGSHEPTR